MHGETLPIIAILFEIISEKGKLHICFHIAIYYVNADGNYAFLMFSNLSIYLQMQQKLNWNAHTLLLPTHLLL